ncbi:MULTISPECIES: CoA transferase subunit A [unclassified Marinobacter]|jgi:acetate CoA/acetoacetate CoA-transferase alpha subunit|uniref:CoA transferase subunit A n=1 Tax=unclassified Marinobacter TaxID=83889 RepID=UPI00200E6E4D|nr:MULTISPECIES: CoA transferase subunit A [unclassified Marinobacter]UQG55367.1 CoA transferase subunit A [Marinobacter sp. M4C]UQG64171.1 CoA transferase subunit A [Marinobacter sp. M2C]UQG68450.1 CoA transferase subunit A [Marinobacter sp. M1C]
MTSLNQKYISIEAAIGIIPDGASIMVGGFGSPGTPFALLDELLAQGQKELTLIKNDANEPDIGIGRLIRAGRVQRLITSHIGLNRIAIEEMNRGQLVVEMYPQGLLAEKIRCAGVGHPGFLTDIGLETEIAQHRREIEVNGQTCAIEPAIHADFSLIHADLADHYGNLVYRGTAINFNPLMAMAADMVIAQAFRVAAPGELKPEAVHTPCAFVNHVVQVDPATSNQGIRAHAV